MAIKLIVELLIGITLIELKEFMKELSIQEKAKRFDKAIERAKSKIKNDKDHILYEDDIIEIFPELKESVESEDERIRKALIDGFTVMKESKNCGKTFSNHNIPVADILAWLEKQGEQMSADNVKSKFNVGDWVVYCNEDVYLITGIEENGYHINNGGYIPFVCESDIRLWTINDAKDGDVLATDSWLYIFKYTNNKAIIQFYCNCPINGKPYKWCFLSDDSYLDIYEDANIHPATKEQCDLLFQKMNEAGYEWDAEKKELKKIEKTFSWSEEDAKTFNRISTILVDASEVKNWWKEYRLIEKDEMIRLTDFLKSISDRTHHQLADWSEEDDRERKRIIGLLEGWLSTFKETCYAEDCKRGIAWLKFIKDRVQPQQEWSEEDENIKQSIIDILTRQGFQTQVNWLKSLRPQKSWKPSDEQITWLYRAADDANRDSRMKQVLNELLEQLKKLKG